MKMLKYILPIKNDYSTLFLLIFFLFFSQLSEARYVVRPLDQAIFHNNRGVEFLNSGDLDRALFEFKTAAELSPEYVESYNNMALVYKFRRQYNQAIDALNKAIKIDRKYVAAHNLLGSIYFAQGNYDAAISKYKTALSLNKKYGDAYYNLGLAYKYYAVHLGKKNYFSEAEKMFSNAVESDPKHYLAGMELGNIYKIQGKKEQAIIRYKTSLEIQPSSPETWANLGTLYLEQGRTSEAQFAINKAVQAHPESAEAHFALGIYYLNVQNLNLAQVELKKALSLDPSLHLARFNLGLADYYQAEILNRQGKTGQAQSFYQKAISAFQSSSDLLASDAEANYNLAYSFSKVGNVNSALDYFQKTLNLNPNHAKALFQLGKLQMSQGNTKEGLSHLCQFTKTAPENLKFAIPQALDIINQNGGKCR